MGTSPCKRGPVRLAACVLAVQTSIIASTGSDVTGPPAHIPVFGAEETAETPSGGGAVPIAHRYGTIPGTGHDVVSRVHTLLGSAVRLAVAHEQRRSRSGRARRTRSARANMRLAHAQAMRHLKRAGMRRTSTGRCANRRVRTCTSLSAVRAGTIRALIRLKRRSGCPIVVTGGTETGHAPGRFSHQSGHKLDIALNPCIDRYITHRFPAGGYRADGTRLYRSRSGDVYAHESDHWDILFR